MSSMAMSRRIWQDAIGRVSTPMRVVNVLLLISAVVAAAVGVKLFNSVPVGILRGAGNPLSVLALLYWSFFMSGAAAQNKPSNACLVPGLTRSVRRTAVLAWLLTMAPFAAISYAHPQGWLLLLCASVGVTALGLYRTGHAAYSTLGSLTLAAYLFVPSHPYLGDALLGAGCALSVLFAAWALPRAFPQGGERHFGMLDKHAQVQASDRLDSSSELARRSGKSRPVYGFVLRRDLASKDGRRLLMHVLGPATHRMAILLPVGAVAVGVLAALPIMHAIGYAPNVEKMTRLLFACLFAMLPFSWYRFAAAIRGAGAEQALARLAPRLPRAPMLNRELGKQILVCSLLEWLAIAALALGTLVLWDAPALSFRVTPAFLVAMLPLLSLGLGDFSGRTTYRFDSAAVIACICWVIAFATIFWGGNTAVWLAMMASILGLSAAVVRSKWRTMMASPPAFPAGRLD